MASRLADRLLTIVITATLTSAAWIVIGSAYVDLDGGEPELTEAEPAEAEPAQAGPAPAASPTQRSGLSASLPSRSQVSQLVIPALGVSAAELTNAYADPRDEGERLHEAIDIPAPAGTTVVAAGPGTIERLFTSAAGGNTIYVRSSDRETIHYYAHLQEYAPGLREGQRVRRGQRLGTVGFTGNADPEAPHLHFAILRTTPQAEWWEPATALNPYPLLGGR
jgi:murein DD-endopeptidase MepM/ murein hydrolase activator NlpD